MMKYILLIAVLALAATKLSFPLKKIQSHAVHAGLISSQNNLTLIDLIHNRTGLYTFNLKLGSSQQEFEVLPDTGSSILWVPSTKCEQCKQFTKFDPTSSETFTATNEASSINYVTGRVNGRKVTDSIELNGLKIDDFKFLLIEQGNVSADLGGIIGLSRFNSDNNESFIEQLSNSHGIEHKIFSQVNQNGKLFFEVGDLPDNVKSDPSNYVELKDITAEPFTYGSSRPYDHWASGLDGVTVGNTLFQLKQMIGIFDTGSNVFIMPVAFLAPTLNNYLKGQDCRPMENETQITCYDLNTDDLPELGLKFGEHHFVIPAENLFFKSFGESTLKVMFSNQLGNAILIGQPFLEAYTVVYNKENETIGVYTETGHSKTSISSVVTPSVLNSHYDFNPVRVSYFWTFIGFVLGVVLTLSLKKVSTFFADLSKEARRKVNERLIL